MQIRPAGNERGEKEYCHVKLNIFKVICHFFSPLSFPSHPQNGLKIRDVALSLLLESSVPCS